MYNEVLTAVPLFILMGVIMERSKVAEDLLVNMGKLARGLPGGLGISVTLVGALLAASTGIVGATVVAMGLLSLPTMLKQGYKPSFAAGSICAAGTLGQIIPPSIVLVFLGDQLSGAYMEAQREVGNFSPDPVSVGDLFAGALIPGVGLALLYMLYQLVIGILRPQDSPPPPADAPGETVALSRYPDEPAAAPCADHRRSGVNPGGCRHADRSRRCRIRRGAAFGRIPNRCPVRA